MTQYIKQPGLITIAPDFSGIAIDVLPAGYYRIACSMQLGFHLVPVDPLQVADKIYGSLLKHIPRIEEVWEERKGIPTTVLLEGLKGSGKSLLMKTLANRFVQNENGVVLLCNQSFTGDDFFEFLQQITQKKIVLMDEFDKTYADKESRNNILTLLDGTMASHTLFILTMNASSNSGGFEFFHNRPGRVFFNIKFKGVDYDAIHAYLEDNLADTTRVAELMTFVKRFTQFNMDMLGTLVREVNACPEHTLEEISEYLNTKPDLTMDDIYFTHQVFRNGMDVTKLVTGVNDRGIKEFLRGMQDPSRATHINIMGTRNLVWNLTKNVERKSGPLGSDTVHEESDEYTSGAMLKQGRKEVFVPYWDEYIHTRQATMTQDPATGVITITGTDRDEHDEDPSEHDTQYTIVLTPEMLKRYTYGF